MVGSWCGPDSISSPRADPDRFGVQAGHPSDPLETTMPQTDGRAPGEPATLLLVQPARQQNELPMVFPLRMLTCPTGLTTALMNRPRRRQPTLVLGFFDSLHQIDIFTKWILDESLSCTSINGAV